MVCGNDASPGLEVMTKRRAFAMLCVLAILLAGCGGSGGGSGGGNLGGNMDLAVPPDQQDILHNPDKVTLFTVVTGWDLRVESSLSEEEFNALPKFGGDDDVRVLGEAQIDAADAKAAIDSFVSAVQDGRQLSAACFMPHHALRVEKGGRTLDIQICFMCMNYKVTPGGGENNVAMSKASGMEDIWRGIVRKHGLRDISDK